MDFNEWVENEWRPAMHGENGLITRLRKIEEVEAGEHGVIRFLVIISPIAVGVIALGMNWRP